MPQVPPQSLWLRLALLAGGITVLEAVSVRVFHIADGRIGSYFGIVILWLALVAVLSGIASRVGWARTLAAALLVMAIGGGAEILGLYNVGLFGRYEYTDWWLPYVTLSNGKLFPLFLPVTWFIIVAICYLLLARRLRGWALVLGTGVLAAAIDLALEPVITRVVLLWRWLEPTPLLGAPYHNFPAWVLVAGLAAAVLHGLGLRRARDLAHPAWMFALGLCCIAIVGVSYGETRGAVALGLLPVAFWARRAS